MNKDQDMTEFFVKALYEWYFGTEIMANYFLEIAMTSFNVNKMYREEILFKMN